MIIILLITIITILIGLVVTVILMSVLDSYTELDEKHAFGISIAIGFLPLIIYIGYCLITYNEVETKSVCMREVIISNISYTDDPETRLFNINEIENYNKMLRPWNNEKLKWNIFAYCSNDLIIDYAYDGHIICLC